jgi:hypothetical protein
MNPQMGGPPQDPNVMQAGPNQMMNPNGQFFPVNFLTCIIIV